MYGPEAQKQSIAEFKHKQQTAFDAERERWHANGQAEVAPESHLAATAIPTQLPAGCRYLSAAVPGSVWKISAAVGTSVAEGEALAILESMKMEIPLPANVAGTVVEWLVTEGSAVTAGQHIAIFRAA